MSGGTKAWDLPTTCGPSQESVTALLLSLSLRARAGSSLRDLQSNLFLSASLKYSFQSSCQQSDETNGKTSYRLTRPMMRSYRVGGEWEGEQEPRSQQPRSAVERPMEDGDEAQWRSVVVLLVLGAPDVTGDLSRHGQARRLRRSPWSRSADGVNHERHFSLWTRREEGQSSRDQQQHTHTSSPSPHTLMCKKKKQAPTSLRPEPMHSGADGLLHWRRIEKRGVKGGEKRGNIRNSAK